MEISRMIKTALRSIARNRMRSLLTMLGIIIGVASVIDMVAVGKGAQADIESRIQSLGTNLLMVMPGSASMRGMHMGAGSRKTLTLADVDKLRIEDDLLAAVSPVARTAGQIVGGEGNWQTSVYGVSPEYLTIRDLSLSTGEMFSDQDVRSSSKKAVIGKTVADQLFPGQDPTGSLIRIKNIPFTIIGVLQEKGQGGMGADQDDIILIPVTTVLNRLAGTRFIDQIMTSVISQDEMDAAQVQIENTLRTSHRLQDGQDSDFSIRNQTDILTSATAMTNTMTLLLGAIAGVSLIVGGIGIMNIMLVSVTERTREIGIRMAIGARGMDIMSQFLVESVVLSIAGGIIGISCALILAYCAQSFGLMAVVDPSTIVLAFLFSAIVGVFFGWYPARKAAALDPIEALRYE